MKYRILNTQLRRTIAEACRLANGGMEICGLLIDNGYFIEMIRMRNKSKKPCSFSFYLAEADAIEKACKQLNHEIVGTFHSHPFSMAEPGNSDIAKAFDNEIMLIIDVIKNEAKLWRVSSKRKKELRLTLLE
jgi:proteasome lid subunit RPN8/RPN11